MNALDAKRDRPKENRKAWFSWRLVARIGVDSQRVKNQVLKAIARSKHKPGVEIRLDCHY
jgi:hypothetical protein